MTTPEISDSDRLTVSGAVSRLVRMNLGCGQRNMDDAVNLERTPATSPDFVHNLEIRPWPFEDERFDEAFAFDVIEHLDNLIGAMKEIHRVCRPGARVHILVPHFSSRHAYIDPTHRRFFSVSTMDYWVPPRWRTSLADR